MKRKKSPTNFNVFEGNRPNMQVRKRCLPLYSHLQRKGPLANFIASGALLVGWENETCPSIPILR